jgi:putative ABC transport system ATP-binding protein
MRRLKMTPIIETRDLWKIHPMDGTGVEALRGVNLAVEPGEFVALVGPSGSGKSTLLHLLGAMDTPTRGEVVFEGKNLAAFSDGERTQLRCRQIGFVFQTFNLLPTLTAFQNVELPLRLARVPTRERIPRARELLIQVGLGARTNHLPRQLSGGERQRVVIARALANHPKLLLADEPTGNLDSVTGKEIIALLQEVHRAGQTIMLVTHNADVGAQANRALHVRDGVIGT